MMYVSRKQGEIYFNLVACNEVAEHAAMYYSKHEQKCFIRYKTRDRSLSVIVEVILKINVV
jgi:hypothetical protein